MNKFFIAILFIVVQTLILSCGNEKGDVGSYINGNTNQDNYTISQEYWGLWKGIDSNREIYISGDSKIDPNSLKKISNNVIQIDGIYYLRASLSNTEVSGKISYPSTISSQSLSDIGSIDIILRRLKDNNKVDKSIEKIKKPDNNGKVIFTVPGGSEYEINGKDSYGNKCNAKIYVSGKKTEIGNCILAQSDSHNFKTKLALSPHNKDAVLFGDYSTYEGYIVIENTGDRAGTGLVATISTDSPYVYKFNYDKEKSTGFSLEPGNTYQIPIEVSFKFLDNWEKDIKFDISIKDVFGRVWNDYVVAHVYRRPFYLKFNKSGSFNGYIVLPGRKILNVPYDYYRLPFIDSENIWLFFANPQGDDVRYSVGIDVEPLSLDNYTYEDIISFEDNDTENQATLLKFNSAIRSFLHSSSEEKDIDIYKLSMKESDLKGILDPIYLKVYEYKIYDLNRTSCNGYDYDYIDENGTKICVAGNGDGVLNPGESAYIQVSIQNLGVSEDRNVKVELSTNDPNILIYRKYANDGNPIINNIDTLMPKEIKDSDNDNNDWYYYLDSLKSESQFIIKANSDVPTPHTAVINVKITDEYGNEWEDYFEININ